MTIYSGNFTLASYLNPNTRQPKQSLLKFCEILDNIAKTKMAIEKNESKILLDKVNSFKTEFDSKRKSSLKKVSVDEMIVNLGNPRLAEKIRIHKVLVVLNIAKHIHNLLSAGRI